MKAISNLSSPITSIGKIPICGDILSVAYGVPDLITEIYNNKKNSETISNLLSTVDQLSDEAKQKLLFTFSFVEVDGSRKESNVLITLNKPFNYEPDWLKEYNEPYYSKYDKNSEMYSYYIYGTRMKDELPRLIVDGLNNSIAN